MESVFLKSKMEKHLPALQVMELGYIIMMDQRVSQFFWFENY